MFREIVMLMWRQGNKYSDGYGYSADPQNYQKELKGGGGDQSSFMVRPEAAVAVRSDLFDYQAEIVDPSRCELRVGNLIRFTATVLDQVIMRALDAGRGRPGASGAGGFSNEVLLMCMKAYNIMTERALKMNRLLESKRRKQPNEDE